MLKNLIYKEFRLNIIGWAYLWFLCVLLLLIPSWVFFVAVAYILFFFMLATQMDKANNDLAFALSLPIPKVAIVTARACTLVIIEVIILILMVPLCILRYFIYPTGNELPMNTNIAFFGFMLVMFATYNIVYLTNAYSRAYRMLLPMLGGYLAALVVGGGLTLMPTVIPSLSVLNDRGLGNLGYQMAVLALGVLLYGGLTYLAHRKASANFIKVDL